MNLGIKFPTHETTTDGYSSLSQEQVSAVFKVLLSGTLTRRRKKCAKYEVGGGHKDTFNPFLPFFFLVKQGLAAVTSPGFGRSRLSAGCPLSSSHDVSSTPLWARFSLYQLCLQWLRQGSVTVSGQETRLDGQFLTDLLKAPGFC
jgi:hypothetical protein